MNPSLTAIQRIVSVGWMAAVALWVGPAIAAGAESDHSLDGQIWDAMIQLSGSNPGYRAEHAKGIVCQGTFTPSKDAATLSKAAHFQGGTIPVTVRFSDGPPDPFIADNSPDAGPRGMAIRFSLPGGQATDIESLSHNGFAVSTGEDFLALLKAILATDRSKPHPWPIETFLASHPAAAKFVQENQAVPASYGTVEYFSNNAFIFANAQGARQAGRYKFLPVAGQRYLGEADAKSKSQNFLGEELRARLQHGPVQVHMVVQLANPEDPTNDSSLVWPDDRRAVDVGVISIGSVVPDSDIAQKALVFFPTDLSDGIELSDDPIPVLRTRVYARSFARRQAASEK